MWFGSREDAAHTQPPLAASNLNRNEDLYGMAKLEQRLYDDAVNWLRDHGFDLTEAPGTEARIFLKKYNVAAAIERNQGGTAKIFAYPGYLVGSEISKLVNRGYQQFLKTSKNEIAATADHLKALHQFTEEFKEALGLPSLYNESLGTVSEAYQYDRIQDRDQPEPLRPKRPWQVAAVGAGKSPRKNRA